MPPVQLQPSRPATPSRSVPSGHGSPLDMGNRVVFATRAVIALREQCGSLGKQLGQNPFLSLLSKILLDVETRLDSATPLKESRVLRLLTDLERLSNWPSFREPKSPSIQTYPRLTRLLNGQPQHIRNSIRLLAGCSSNAASRDRTTFRKTFEAFANAKCGPRGPEISDLVSNPKPPLHDDTTECLQRLYLTLHKTCRCAATSEGKDFKANIALEVIPPSPDLDGVKVDVFFRHRHISNDEIDEWKEAQIRVLLESQNSEEGSVGNLGL
ncbi:hypothetical protein TWF506_000010 [Arthrobotrys conoides]|uniref:Uncharacterized protein n=1 Tax=Arthrobotrys conoides TaxID=74498 RepID=A0AAN8NV24_9PEZI